MSILPIIYLSILTIVSAIGMVRFKKLTIPFKILAFSVITTLPLEVLAEIFVFKYHNNALIYHFESLTGYIFYSLAYLYLFKSNIVRRAILISIPIIIVFFVINGIVLQPMQSVFPTNVYLVTNALYVLLSLLLFKQMLQYPLNINIVKQSIFWFNIAILFFSTTMFLNMGLLNYYANHKWGYDIIYYFWAGNFWLLNILICVSLLMDNKTLSTEHG